MTDPESSPYPPCPECGGVERRQKMHCVICEDCRVVLENTNSQVVVAVTLADAVENEHSGGDS